MQSHFLCAFWWWIEIYNEYESHVDIPQFAFEIPLIDCNSDKLPGKYTTISLLKLKQNKYICLECNNVTECWAPLETSLYKLWFSNIIWCISSFVGTAHWMSLGHPLHVGTIRRIFPARKALVCHSWNLVLCWSHWWNSFACQFLLEDRVINLWPITMSTCKDN